MLAGAKVGEVGEVLMGHLDIIGVKVGEGGIGGIHVDVGRLKAVGRSLLEAFEKSVLCMMM